MPRPLPIVCQSDSLIKIVDINSHNEWQTVQVQISWLLQKPTDLDLHCLQRQGYQETARQGLNGNTSILFGRVKRKGSFKHA